MAASFVVYIDESGDEGFVFGNGSTEWFVLSGVVIRKAQDLDVVKLADRIREKLGKAPRRPLHFRDLRHEQRVPCVAEIAKTDLRTISVMVYKPSVKEAEKFQTRHRLYFYCVRLLLERVSWLCRDTRKLPDTGDGSAKIVFSNRSGMSYTELRSYLALLRDMPEVQIEWSAIKTDRIKALPMVQRAGLQIADAVATSFFYAVQPSRHGFTEDRYARMLKPVVYRRKGRYLGYGLKFFPQEVVDLLETEESLRWVKSDYETKNAGPGPQDPTH